MKVIVPMAGRGSRFADQGYYTPKPLIEVNGQIMIKRALKSIEDLEISEIFFIILHEHEKEFELSKILKKNLDIPTRFIFLEDVINSSSLPIFLILP